MLRVVHNGLCLLGGSNLVDVVKGIQGHACNLLAHLDYASEPVLIGYTEVTKPGNKKVRIDSMKDE